MDSDFNIDIMEYSPATPEVIEISSILMDNSEYIPDIMEYSPATLEVIETNPSRYPISSRLVARPT